MKELTSREQLERQKYVAGQAPMLLASILSGIASSGKIIDPQECVAAAIRSAEELFDQLCVTVP